MQTAVNAGSRLSNRCIVNATLRSGARPVVRIDTVLEYLARASTRVLEYHFPGTPQVMLFF